MQHESAARAYRRVGQIPHFVQVEGVEIVLVVAAQAHLQLAQPDTLQDAVPPRPRAADDLHVLVAFQLGELRVEGVCVHRLFQQGLEHFPLLLRDGQHQPVGALHEAVDAFDQFNVVGNVWVHLRLEVDDTRRHGPRLIRQRLFAHRHVVLHRVKRFADDPFPLRIGVTQVQEVVAQRLLGPPPDLAVESMGS